MIGGLLVYLAEDLKVIDICFQSSPTFRHCPTYEDQPTVTEQIVSTLYFQMGCVAVQFKSSVPSNLIVR